MILFEKDNVYFDNCNCQRVFVHAHAHAFADVRCVDSGRQVCDAINSGLGYNASRFKHLLDA